MAAKPKQQNKSFEITKSSGNVFADLNIEDAERYQARADLSLQINSILQHRGLEQKEAAKILSIDPPKISALNCGRLDGFSIDRLIGFLNRFDRDVEIVVKKRPTRRKTYGHLKVAFG